MTERLQGTVKFFKAAEGYGFISRPDEPDVYVHYSELQQEGFKTLVPDQVVEFEIGEGRKGPAAKNVIVV